jgi:hypothetical protein
MYQSFLGRIDSGALKLIDATSDEFGATGDGVTDDTLAIQAALHYAADYAPAAVYLPRGLYIVDAPLHLGDPASSSIMITCPSSAKGPASPGSPRTPGPLLHATRHHHRWQQRRSAAGPRRMPADCRDGERQSRRQCDGAKCAV